MNQAASSLRNVCPSCAQRLAFYIPFCPYCGTAEPVPEFVVPPARKPERGKPHQQPGGPWVDSIKGAALWPAPPPASTQSNPAMPPPSVAPTATFRATAKQSGITRLFFVLCLATGGFGWWKYDLAERFAKPAPLVSGTFVGKLDGRADLEIQLTRTNGVLSGTYRTGSGGTFNITGQIGQDRRFQFKGYLRNRVEETFEGQASVDGKRLTGQYFRHGENRSGSFSAERTP